MKGPVVVGIGKTEVKRLRVNESPVGVDAGLTAAPVEVCMRKVVGVTALMLRGVEIAPGTARVRVPWLIGIP